MYISTVSVIIALAQTALVQSTKCNYRANVISAQSTCPDGWYKAGKYGASCYLLEDEDKTFAEAKSACVELGGSLAALENVNENVAAKVYLLIEKAVDSNVWIGGRRLPSSGNASEFVWLSGSQMYYNDWLESAVVDHESAPSGPAVL